MRELTRMSPKKAALQMDSFEWRSIITVRLVEFMDLTRILLERVTGWEFS